MKITPTSKKPITPGNFPLMRRLGGIAIAASVAIGFSASLPSAHAQVTATGGTVTSYTADGITYEVRTFTGSGTFTVTGGGSVNYLIVGGGGGGGASTGGGGGAGGFVTGTTTVTDSTAYTITVGAGGAGGIQASAPYRGSNGGDSIFAGITAFGGGGGGSNAPATPPPGLTDPSVGGSGGGGSGASGRPGASGTSLQGNAGGSANNWGGPYSAGGGGGAGAAGANANGSNTGANGGAGLSSSITGTAKFYAGGGGGGMFNGSTGGSGGVGGGGNGGKPGAPTSGAANTGGGGGGQQQNQAGAAGSGGSGVVIISYVSTSPNPTSTNATLAANENVSTALAASNFGYADPNSSPLANVQITSLPALGTLKNSGATVVSGDLPLTVSAANIGNLTYQSPLGGFGNAYTTMGIRVQNSASPTGLWSADALMTFNVTHVNQAPTSSGGSVILRKNTVKTFAAADFTFSDIDAGDTLGAIKVTSLPANGTLTLSASAVTLNQVIAVADITAGNLIYTPSTDYTGSDPFNFQVRDAALFSADAIMALTVTPDIIVQNPSFETIGAALGGPWATAAAVWNANLTYAQTNDNSRFATRTDAGTWYANLSDPGNTFYQNLSTNVTSGDTLAVTFYAGRENGRDGGVMAATFLVDGTPYTETFDTTGLTAGTWQSYTLTKTIANSGALTLRFSNVSGRPWLDNISNISVTTPSGGTTYALTYTAGANGSITGDTPQTVASGASGTAVTAVAATGYSFVDWSDGSTDNPRTDSNVTADVSVTANFAIDTYTLTYTAGANGTITGDTPQTVDYNTSGTAVTAVPATGYSFVDWSDGSTDNPRTDSNVAADASLTANFAIDTFTLTYTAGANGSITGTTPQTVDYNTSGTAVTAVPATGYSFVDWSDGSTDNPRTDSNVTANVSVTANFAIDAITYADWATANGVTGGVNGDSNNDGVPNGLAYFMGVTGQATNPGLNANNEVTWPVNSDYQGTFEVQTSSDLSTWTPADPQPTPADGNLTYTLTSGQGKQFVRLLVTPTQPD